MIKDNIQENLVLKGRKLIQEKGVEFLTARKLSEASGYSVGTIYNQFSNMDNFILIQNYLTLGDLKEKFSHVDQTLNPYARLQAYTESFVDFVLENKNLWFLVHDFHLHHNNRRFSKVYLRRVIQIVRLTDTALRQMLPDLALPERLLSARVLWLTLFSLSAYLTTDALDKFGKINKKTLGGLLLNTFLAGLKILEKL